MPGDSTAERKLEITEAIVARLEADARVVSVGYTEIPPLTPASNITMALFVPDGKTRAEMQEERRTQAPEEFTQTRQVSPGYLRTFALALSRAAGSASVPVPARPCS